RERPNFRPIARNSTNNAALSYHRHREIGADATQLNHIDGHWRASAIGVRVPVIRKVDRLALRKHSVEPGTDRGFEFSSSDYPSREFRTRAALGNGLIALTVIQP